MADPEEVSKHIAPVQKEADSSLSSKATPHSADAEKNTQSRIQVSANDELPATEEKPFRFMDLPRELRDEVYARLGRDSVIAKKNSIELSIKDGSRTSLLLVNRQFGKEYSESVARYASLDGRDGSWQAEGYNFVPDSVELPKTGLVKSITAASFHLVGFCTSDWPEDCHDDDCTAVVDLERNIAWVSELQPHLPNLKHAEIWLYVCIVGDGPDAQDTAEWPTDVSPHHLTKMIEEIIQPLESTNAVFKVRYKSVGDVSFDEIYLSELQVAQGYGTWTKAEGWKAGVDKDDNE